MSNVLPVGNPAAARRVQRPREAADYDAQPVTQEEAASVVELAERFVAALETALGGDHRRG